MSSTYADIRIGRRGRLPPPRPRRGQPRLPDDLQAVRERRHRADLQQGLQQWGSVFGDEVLATAILDRLLHHCEVIAINGPSYRLKNRLAAVGATVKTATA